MMTLAAARDRATEAPDAPSRLLRSPPPVGHADRPRAVVDGHVPGVAALDRPPARRTGVAGAAHDFVLFVRFCHRAGVSWTAVGSPRPAAGADRCAGSLSHCFARLRIVVFL